MERGLKEFISIFTDQQTLQFVDIIQTLSQLLVHTDADCVLNATGTLGTIVCRFEKSSFFVCTMEERKTRKTYRG